jgi:hypothetical protein
MAQGKFRRNQLELFGAKGSSPIELNPRDFQRVNVSALDKPLDLDINHSATFQYLIRKSHVQSDFRGAVHESRVKRIYIPKTLQYRLYVDLRGKNVFQIQDAFWDAHWQLATVHMLFGMARTFEPGVFPPAGLIGLGSRLDSRSEHGYPLLFPRDNGWAMRMGQVCPAEIYSHAYLVWSSEPSTP